MLRARIKCPVCLLVIAGDDTVARWEAKPIEIGGNHRLVPWVLGLSGVPEIVDPAQAEADPELAVLSAMAHGQDPDTATSVQIAFNAQLASLGLDADRARLYFDLILSSLSEAARRELQAMDPRKYEYQSDFAKRYVAQGEASGRAAIVMRQLTIRFGSLSAADQAQIAQSSITELDAIGERLLTAKSTQEALGSH